MANRWLASALVDSLKRRGLIPTADETFAAADFYALIDEETRSYLLPLIREIHEELLFVRSDSDIVASQYRYPFPPRCAAEAIKTLLFESASDGGYRPLTRVEPEQAYSSSGSAASCYYLEDDAAILVPTPTGADGTLRFIHFNRPNLVVAPTAAAEITAINTATKQLTLRLADQAAGVPATFLTTALYDFIKGTPGFRSLAIDQVCTVVASNVLTFSAELPDGLAVGDFVALAGESPVPQVPAEFHPLLAQRVNFVALDALSPRESAKAELTLEKMEAKARTLFSNRTESQPRYAHNFHAPGWGRYRRGPLR